MYVVQYNTIQYIHNNSSFVIMDHGGMAADPLCRTDIGPKLGKRKYNTYIYVHMYIQVPQYVCDYISD